MSIYKTLGTLVFEVTGVIPDIETSKKLGLLVKDYDDRLRGHFVYVQEPLREEDRFIYTRAYDIEGQQIVREIIEDFIKAQQKKKDFALLEMFVNDKIPFHT